MTSAPQTKAELLLRLEQISDDLRELKVPRTHEAAKLRELVADKFTARLGFFSVGPSWKLSLDWPCVFLKDTVTIKFELTVSGLELTEGAVNLNLVDDMPCSVLWSQGPFD